MVCYHNSNGLVSYLCMGVYVHYVHVHKNNALYNIMFNLIALAVYSRSPSAYTALKSLGVLQLPCKKTLQGHMKLNRRNPGICEDDIHQYSEKFRIFKEEMKQRGSAVPLGQGVLIWDETKVRAKRYMLSNLVDI